MLKTIHLHLGIIGLLGASVIYFWACAPERTE